MFPYYIHPLNPLTQARRKENGMVLGSTCSTHKTRHKTQDTIQGTRHKTQDKTQSTKYKTRYKAQNTEYKTQSQSPPPPTFRSVSPTPLALSPSPPNPLPIASQIPQTYRASRRYDRQTRRYVYRRE
ncbi:hypothetical protein K402DRAFT_90391 [Aulographum hederae CBS 113979]|uniref:Uncharacterized protein n=1 Tax=Aulographum hederae CBS 113979 TaxID=1176131 RepID=A0A6G1GZ88_9PEZI|nr:hypothetical protein K402DRAFT_90391 [Aulographum hederae CBS 113979]